MKDRWLEVLGVAVAALGVLGFLIWFNMMAIALWWHANWWWITVIVAVLTSRWWLPPVREVLSLPWSAFTGIASFIDDRKMQDEHLLLLASVRERIALGDDTEYKNAVSCIEFRLSVPKRAKIVEEFEETGEVEGDSEPLQIEAPKVYGLSDQLRSQGTKVNEETSIVGYVEGEPLRGKLFNDDGNMFDSVFVIGDQGFGKSTLAVYLACLTVMHHGRIIVIDPDAEFGQSLSVRLGPLANELFLLCPIADTPERAAHAVKVAREELESPGDYPVIWLIDEFSMIMRQATNGTGKWAEVGKEIGELTEDWATRGRKRRRRIVAFGQIPNAKRTGGTEFRDSTTVMSFHMKKKRAQMVLDSEEAELTSDLGPGEVIVVPARSSEASYRMQLPFPDLDGLTMVARTMAQMASEYGSDGSEYVKGFEPEPLSNRSCIISEPSLEPFVVDPVAARIVKVRRIRDLRANGKNQSQIIETIYGVRKGGGTEYAKARDEYLSIIQFLSSNEGEI